MNFRQFIRLIRVPTLAATAVPLIIGGAIALVQNENGGIDFSPPLWLDLLIVALLIQMATNMLNEYGDYRHKIDTVPSPGFAGLIVSGETSAREILLTAVVSFTIAFALGIILVWYRGLLLLLLGMVSLLVGVFYSEGPLPISSTPFGELFVGVVMGPVEVISSNLAAAGQISNFAILFSIPVSFMVAAILLTNNLRDLEKDRGHGRKTLAVLIGKRYGNILLLVLMILSFLWTIPAFLLFSTPFSIFLVWLAFPVALRNYLQITQKKRWPESVAMVSRLHLLVGLLLTVSILLIHF
jgi:1,4-dihydroxy-2-naphthoate polyprenyltransferase